MNFQAARDAITAFGGRKFLITVLFGIFNVLLVIHGHIPAEIYRDLFLGSVAAFIAGNVYQKKVRNDQQPDD